jgi:hypothetical protein
VDSIKASYSNVVLVDGGGFFPESDNQQDVAWFLMDAMRMLGTVAVGTSEKDLRWGISFLKAQVERSRLPMVCANLLEAGTRRHALKPYVIQKIGRAKVGFFGLMSDKVDLGVARDSLRVEEPALAARRTVDELRKKGGATVVVLLSQLGKVESEDLAAAVPGIDAVVIGHNVPFMQKGRMVKNTVTSYGGEQGQYVSRTILTLDSGGRMTTGENETFMLGPEIPDDPEFAKLVKNFEDAFNEKMRKLDKERAASTSTQDAQATDHFLGADLCMRCHQSEAEQWKTTSHSQAWQTLIDVKKDATPECIGCHVVGFKQPGGFQTGSDVPRLANVQCENCHGMETKHTEFATTLRIQPATCITCHHGENDPEFDWDKKLPMVAHGNVSGETIQRKKVKGPTSSHPMMKSGSH